ncbi:hypothetical protein KY360_01750 [Candidatus Woesearchaeota archaeon]|nr:hypothetical protein [Candidatus Woesearchaeota archaeon]
MRGKKGQTIWEYLLAIFICIIASLLFAGFTKLFAKDNIFFLLFLGYLFLVVAIIFGFNPDVKVKIAGTIVSGCVSFVSFFLSWAIPKGIFLFESVKGTLPP